MHRHQAGGIVKRATKRKKMATDQRDTDSTHTVQYTACWLGGDQRHPSFQCRALSRFPACPLFSDPTKRGFSAAIETRQHHPNAVPSTYREGLWSDPQPVSTVLQVRCSCLQPKSRNNERPKLLPTNQSTYAHVRVGVRLGFGH